VQHVYNTSVRKSAEGAGFVCDKATIVRDTIKGTPPINESDKPICKYDIYINICLQCILSVANIYLLRHLENSGYLIYYVLIKFECSNIWIAGSILTCVFLRRERPYNRAIPQQRNFMFQEIIVLEALNSELVVR
jgi:hypothetical protein